MFPSRERTCTGYGAKPRIWLGCGTEAGHEADGKALAKVNGDPQRIWNAVLSLRTFTIDFAVAMLLGEGGVKRPFSIRTIYTIVPSFDDWNPIQARFGLYA